jgi:RNA polymerase sigma-70 factor (ECF subfamily)
VQSQLATRLNQAIRRLPPVLRDVTEIRHSGDFSVEEVAGMAGLTVAATKSRLLRARKILATRLAPDRRAEGFRT